MKYAVWNQEREPNSNLYHEIKANDKQEQTHGIIQWKFTQIKRKRYHLKAL